MCVVHLNQLSIIFTEESKGSKERIPVKEEGDLPDDFIFEDEANTDDLWSDEARLKYGTKPKPGEEDEWNKWVMGGLSAQPNRRYENMDRIHDVNKRVFNKHSTQSRFASVFLDSVLGPPRQAPRRDGVLLY